MLGALLTLIIYSLIIGLLLWLLSYVLAVFPVPDPFRRIIWVAAVVIAVIFAIILLLDLVGAGGGLGVPRFRL
jgi:hypothetical protein